MEDWLSATARACPAAVGLITDGGTWTYRALNEQVAMLCAALVQQGIQRGHHVGVLMPNGAEYVFLIHALARLGAVLVPLNTRLTGPELAFQIAKARCHMLIHSADLSDKITESAVCRIPIATLLADQAESSRYTAGMVELDAVQAIVFTSGTTGQPKGAQITFGNYYHGATASSWRLGTLPDDQWLACLPLYHVGGLAIIWRCCLYGTAVVLHNGFDLDRVRQALTTQPITLISVVPTMLYRLLEADVPFPPSLRLVLLGGAAASPALIERCAARNIPVAMTYGLTETASQVATLLPADVYRKPGSVGKPLVFSSVQIVDADEVEVPSGTLGEVVVRGPTVMAGYFDHDDSRTLRGDVLYTGDIGYLDGDGDLWIVQRRKDLIISGGENIYPIEIENVLGQHPAVAEAIVVGVPDAEWGQIVAAVIVLREGQTLSQAALDAFCKERLASYKRPRLVRFVATLDDLPQTGSGKINRQRLADDLAALRNNA